MLVENIVAQMLRASGHRLYFYSQYSNVADDRMEIDFLIQKPTISNRHNISPIEVKSSTRYTLTSLGKFMKKYIVELREKMAEEIKESKILKAVSKQVSLDKDCEDAMLALTGLGFNKQECVAVLSKAKAENVQGVQALIAYSLKNIK